MQGPNLDVKTLTSKVDPSTERIKKNYNGRGLITGIQMKRIDLTKAFVMISNWRQIEQKNPFGLHGLYKQISALQGAKLLLLTRHAKSSEWKLSSLV